MATATKICRVCGKEYKYCKTNRRNGVFRWQDVACSPEHGAIYFAQIEASRKAAVVGEPAQQPVIDSSLLLDLADEDDEDELFEEFFDDSDEDLDIEM